MIYKSFFTSFDISQFTNDDDINTMIQEALDWFGYIPTGIEPNPISDEQFVIVYPNPNNGIFNIEISNKEITNSSIQICNMQGKIILQKDLSNSVNYTENIDISNFAKGIYLLKVEIKGKSIFKKLIVQ